VKKKEYKARIKELEDRLALYEPPPDKVPAFITVDGIRFGHFDPAAYDPTLSANVFVAESSSVGHEGGDSLDLVREALAAYAHEAWSGWMKYMFEKGDRIGHFNAESVNGIDILWQMPAWAYGRWTRQMRTSYADLPEVEKESDRAEADTILRIVGEVSS
jgi:hypothetical protein